MCTISSFKFKEYKHDTYKGKDCMKESYEALRQHAIELINVKMKNGKS